MYEVCWKVINDDGYDYCSDYVMSSSHQEAKHIGAWLLRGDCEYIDVERASEFDEYAALGYVPPEILLKNYGWQWECNNCGTQILYDHGWVRLLYEDEREELDTDDEYESIIPIFVGQTVYCSHECRHEKLTNFSKKKEARVTAIELTLQTFPHSEIIDTKLYGWNSHNPNHYIVEFRYPGCIQTAKWQGGEDTIQVHPADQATYQRYKFIYKGSSDVE